jgi:hypothetical protein
MAARLLRLLLAVVVAIPVIGVAPGTALHADCAAAAGDPSHHVPVVVEHGNGAVVRVCVGFSGSSIGAEEALGASGLHPGVDSSSGYGDEVCQIDGEPATYDPQNCLNAGKPFWSLWVSRGGGGWALSPVGVSSLSLGDGDAEGWHFDTGSAGAPPSPRGTCPTATPAPTRTPIQTRPSPPAHVPATTSPPAPTVAPATGAQPRSTPATSVAVGLLPSPEPSQTAGPLLRSGPAVAQPPTSATSRLGWALLGVLLTAALASLAAQLWRRGRSA